MADRAINDLVAASQVTPTDLFVLEQSATAKKLTGQILANWLMSFADGHGGIASITYTAPTAPSLYGTLTITLADETDYDVPLLNGRGIEGIVKTGTEGLVDTYTVTYTDLTTDTFTVTNGAQGIQGVSSYTWIRWSENEPQEDEDMTTIPSAWMGIYSGTSSTAPTDYTEYQWYEVKGMKGDQGDPAAISTTSVEYVLSLSGVTPPSGGWSTTIPTPQSGYYLWTRTTVGYDDPNHTTVISYSVSYYGINGTGVGTVTSVNQVAPDAAGNVDLTAADIGAGNMSTSTYDPIGDVANEGGIPAYVATAISGVEGAVPIIIDFASFSSLPQTKSDADITSDMVVYEAILGNPIAQTGDWTVTTSTGSVTVSGTISGSTTLRLILGKANT